LNSAGPMTNQEYPNPWRPIGAAAENFERELRMELSPGHVLYGIKAIPLAMRDDCDDVLFGLEDGPAPFAIVHLTWSSVPEQAPDYPMTRLGRHLESLLQ
jgi:hypothetical protein